MLNTGMKWLFSTRLPQFTLQFCPSEAGCPLANQLPSGSLSVKWGDNSRAVVNIR